MESSSIVSFNNDSTLQSTIKPEHSNVNVHELALHAMRDRCLLLQRRINSLEADNMRLKLDSTKNKVCSPYTPLQDDEKLTLHQKIAELSKQRSQLMHHIFMVSCENKTLWTKISTIKKVDKPLQLNKPLLRTNTYINSTPKANASGQEKFSESSLEEISLKLINSYIQEKSQLVEQYAQMTQLQDMDEDLLNVESIGFNYMEDPATDSLKEIRNQTMKMHELKQELAKQEQELKLVISRVEQIVNEGYKCPSCQLKSTKTTSSEHKEIETSDSLANWATPVESTNYTENYSENNAPTLRKEEQNEELNIENQTDKICPMCGQCFAKVLSFQEFQSHVESHFIGETEPDSIIDNFENIPNSVDNMLI